MTISSRLLQENELTTADYIFRYAFGTFVGLPQPTDFCGDANYVQPRWKIDPTAAFAAELDGEKVWVLPPLSDFHHGQTDSGGAVRLIDRQVFKTRSSAASSVSSSVFSIDR